MLALKILYSALVAARWVIMVAGSSANAQFALSYELATMMTHLASVSFHC